MNRGKSHLNETDEDWLATLADPRTELHVYLDGFPGYCRFESGWGIRFDALPVHLLHFIVDGEIACRAGQEAFTLRAPAFSCVRPGTPLDYASTGPKVTMYRFRLAATRRGRTLACPHEVLQSGQAQRLHSQMEQIVEAAEHPERLSGWQTRGLVLALFAGAMGETSATAPGPGLDRARLREVTTWFHLHHREWPAPAELAKRLQLSPDYFARLFRQATGLSPRAWMTRERIRLAALQLVESNRNISEVAEAFGYNNVFFFSQQFKDVMKMSPSAYQRERRSG